MEEIQYIVYSYLGLNQLLRFLDYVSIDQVLKRYPRVLPEIKDLYTSYNIRVFEFLVYRGYRFIYYDFRKFILNKNYIMLAYLYQNCKLEYDDSDLIQIFSDSKYIDVLEFLIRISKINFY